MLSISRLVPLGHGHSDLQEMERYRAIDFPVAGPSQATDQQKDILAAAPRAVVARRSRVIQRRSDCAGLTGRQNSCFSECQTTRRADRFTWGDLRLVVLPAGLAELPTFMCEQRGRSVATSTRIASKSPTPWGGLGLPTKSEQDWQTGPSSRKRKASRFVGGKIWLTNLAEHSPGRSPAPCAMNRSG